MRRRQLLRGTPILSGEPQPSKDGSEEVNRRQWTQHMDFRGIAAMWTLGERWAGLGGIGDCRGVGSLTEEWQGAAGLSGYGGREPLTTPFCSLLRNQQERTQLLLH